MNQYNWMKLNWFWFAVHSWLWEWKVKRKVKIIIIIIKNRNSVLHLHRLRSIIIIIIIEEHGYEIFGGVFLILLDSRWIKLQLRRKNVSSCSPFLCSDNPISSKVKFSSNWMEKTLKVEKILEMCIKVVSFHLYPISKVKLY